VEPDCGGLPPGLSLAASGQISGIPVGEGTFSFAVAVSDSAGGQASAAISMSVLGPQLLVIRQGTSPEVQGKVGLDDNWTVLASTLPGKIAVAGNRIAVLTPGHELYAKDGLNGNWFNEAGDVTSFAANG